MDCQIDAPVEFRLAEQWSELGQLQLPEASAEAQQLQLCSAVRSGGQHRPIDDHIDGPVERASDDLAREFLETGTAQRPPDLLKLNLPGRYPLSSECFCFAKPSLI